MLGRQLRRQLFQFRNAGVLSLVKKFSTLRKLITDLDSFAFGQYRLRKKILNAVPNAEKIFDSFGKPDAVNLETCQEVAGVAKKSLLLRDSLKLTEASTLLSESLEKFPNSIELLKLLAQVYFRMGEWKKFVSTLVATSSVRDLVAEEMQISKLNHRFLGSDWTGPLGHIVQLAAVIKLERLNLSSNEKRVLLFDPKFVANSSLLNLIGSYLPMIKSNRIDIDKFTKQFEVIFDDVPTFRMKNGVIDQWSAIDIANYEWKKCGNSSLLKLDGKTKTKGGQILKKWGLAESDWFVAMHVREGAHRDQARLPNADVNSYLPMIQEITKRGGYVIRMGSPLMTPLPKMSNVIDYAHAVERVDWMDVFLWASAKFFVGTQSGGSEAAMCFDTPTIRTNFSSYGHCFWSDRSFMVPKMYKMSTQTEPMNLRDSLRSPIPHCESTVHQNFKFEVIDNSADDLTNAAKEMFLRLESDNWKLTDRQEMAQAIRTREGAVGRLPIADSFLEAHPSFIEK